MKRCLIVDGCSTGKYLPHYLRKYGYQCIHLQSHPHPYAIEHGGVDPAEYEICLVHNGDFEKTLSIVLDLKLDFIIPGSEPGVELGNELSFHSGLCPNGEQTGTICRNKFLTHEALSKAGLSHIYHCVTDDISKALEWARLHSKWPIVLKPVDSGGGDGFHLCENEADVEKAFKTLLARSTIFEEKNQTVLLEEYVDGPEYVVNVVSYEGVHFIESVMQQHKIQLSDGHIIYDRSRLLVGEEIPDIECYIKQALDALDVRFGATHNELKLTVNGPVLIECNARLMGGSITPEIFSSCLGHNQVELTVMAYADPENFYRYIQSPHQMRKHLSILYLRAFKAGYLESFRDLEKIRALRSFAQLRLFVKEGDFVQKTVDLPTAVGDVFLVHDEKEVVEQDWQVIRLLELRGILETSEKAFSGRKKSLV